MTLTEYCTGIADAIREKEGSTGVIPAPDHAARIKALSSNSDFETVTVTFLYQTGNCVYTNAKGKIVESPYPVSSIEVAKNTVFYTYCAFPVTTGGVHELGGYMFYADADGTLDDD